MEISEFDINICFGMATLIFFHNGIVLVAALWGSRVADYSCCLFCPIIMEPCLGILFWFCVALGIFGIAVAAVGSIVQAVFFNGESFVDSNFLSAPSLLIFIGVIIFLVAFLGCCAASKKNYYLLMTFSILMLLLFILGLSGGIACYFQRNQLENGLEDRFNKSMSQYSTNVELKKIWDIMQNDLQCCGTKGPKDWIDMNHNATLPESCCKEIPFDETTRKLLSCTTEYSYAEGCMPVLVGVLKRKVAILGIAAAVVACIQIIIVVFTCYLAGTIRSEYQTV